MQFLMAEQGLNADIFDAEAVGAQTNGMRENIRKVEENEKINTYAPIFTHFQRGEKR